MFPDRRNVPVWAVRVVQFVAVGGTATAVHFGLLALAVEWGGVPEVVASVLAFCFASLINYSLNYRLTFSAAENGVGHQRALPRFVLVASAGLTLNTLCFSLLLPFVHYLLAQVVATLLTLCFNFLLHQFWIYKAESWNP